jgi:di/tricarboxylate transporter
MSVDIILILLILLGAVVLFATEWLRMDVVALIVLCLLAIFSLVTPEQAISGFSHPAVVTIWAMFILSDGLTRAGLADVLGQKVLKVAGHSEMALVVAFMLLAGLISAFMNNIGVAALLLPVVVGVARQSGVSASRLLMPMAFGCLLGGALTLIGTPPNLLVSAALQDAGFDGFSFFDFTPIAVPVLLVATAFVALIGRHWLPNRDLVAETGDSRDLRELYSLQERIFAIQVPADSLLVNKSLGETGLTSAAGLMIIALSRLGQTQALPSSATRLQAGDILLAQGVLDRFRGLRYWSELTIEREAPVLHDRLLEQAGLYELRVGEKSTLIGKRINPADFYDNNKCWLLAIRQGDKTKRTHLSDYVLAAGDELLVQADEKTVNALLPRYDLGNKRGLDKEQVNKRYQLDERLLVFRVPQEAALIGRSVSETRLSHAFDLRLLAMFRDGEFIRPLPPEQEIQGLDLLLVQGRYEDFEMLRGLQQFKILDDATPYMKVFEQGKLGMVEAIMHPHKWIDNKSVSDLKLSEAWQVEVAALWRGGRPYRSGLKDMLLQRGDALLLVAPIKQLSDLNKNRDLIILNPVSSAEVDRTRAPIALLSMLLVVLISLSGVLPVYLAAMIGATLMVLGRCLSMEQAYKAIHWRSIVLLAGMMPLGAALQGSGAADYLSGLLLQLTGDYNPWFSIAALYFICVLATLLIPVVVLVVLMAPIGIALSLALDVQPYPAMMAIALAASASVASPIAHPTNVLVMGPGAYRFVDFLKLGLPLTLLVFAVGAVLMPLVWPL